MSHFSVVCQLTGHSALMPTETTEYHHVIIYYQSVPKCLGQNELNWVMSVSWLQGPVTALLTLVACWSDGCFWNYGLVSCGKKFLGKCGGCLVIKICCNIVWFWCTFRITFAIFPSLFSKHRVSSYPTMPLLRCFCIYHFKMCMDQHKLPRNMLTSTVLLKTGQDDSMRQWLT